MQNLPRKTGWKRRRNISLQPTQVPIPSLHNNSRWQDTKTAQFFPHSPKEKKTFQKFWLIQEVNAPAQTQGMWVNALLRSSMIMNCKNFNDKMTLKCIILIYNLLEILFNFLFKIAEINFNYPVHTNYMCSNMQIKFREWWYLALPQSRSQISFNFFIFVIFTVALKGHGKILTD